MFVVTIINNKAIECIKNIIGNTTTPILVNNLQMQGIYDCLENEFGIDGIDYIKVEENF